MSTGLAGEAQPLLRNSSFFRFASERADRSSYGAAGSDGRPTGGRGAGAGRESGDSARSAGGASARSGISDGIVEKKTTWWNSVFAIVTTAIGAGIVTLPRCFSNVGWGVAAAMVAFCTLASVEAANRLCDALEVGTRKFKFSWFGDEAGPGPHS